MNARKSVFRWSEKNADPLLFFVLSKTVSYHTLSFFPHLTHSNPDHPIRHECDDRRIVRDKHIGHIMFFLDMLQQVQDLSLDRKHQAPRSVHPGSSPSAARACPGRSRPAGPDPRRSGLDSAIRSRSAARHAGNDPAGHWDGPILECPSG